MLIFNVLLTHYWHSILILHILKIAFLLSYSMCSVKFTFNKYSKNGHFNIVYVKHMHTFNFDIPLNSKHTSTLVDFSIQE